MDNVIVKVLELWEDILVVHTGHPPHPQFQGAVGRANEDVAEIMGNLLRDHGTSNWILGCQFVVDLSLLKMLQTEQYLNGLLKTCNIVMLPVQKLPLKFF